jgi:hypothetical protein
MSWHFPGGILLIFFCFISVVFLEVIESVIGSTPVHPVIVTHNIEEKEFRKCFERFIMTTIKL